MPPPHPLPQLIPNRAQAALARVSARVWRERFPLSVEAGEPTPEHAGWMEASVRPLRPVAPGEAWGRLYDQRWARIVLPAGAARGKWHLEWREQGEATAYIDGEPWFGFDVAHRYALLPAKTREVWLECYCCQSAIWHPDATGLSIQGSRFDGAWLARRDDEAWEATHDLAVLVELMMHERARQHPPQTAPLNSSGLQTPLVRATPRYRQLLRRLDEAVDAFDTDGIAALRRALGRVYRDLRSSRPRVRATLTGHAHIDLVWLWTEAMGEAKAVHTFATANRLMALYPEFRFAYSQPASYEAVGRRAPGLLRAVRSRVRSGQWQATGALYVESDTLLPCGEALARSFMLGQEGFRELRGAPARLVWLPDVFGYSGCLPQLARLAGAEYFFTTKLTWNAINGFPYGSFIWRGTDGSEVVAHVTQGVGYNNTVNLAEIHANADGHAQADVHPEFLHPVGYGDGGGGPTAEMCERARRLGALGDGPAVAWDQPEAFFDRLARRRAKLPVWQGECYLEYHRGTFTSHGNVKAAFRALERALQTREAVAVALGDAPDLSAVWKRAVFAQFHDYIPGSSVPEVYREGVAELTRHAREQYIAARAALDAAGGVGGSTSAWTTSAADDTEVVPPEGRGRDVRTEGNESIIHAHPNEARVMPCLFNPLPQPWRGWVRIDAEEEAGRSEPHFVELPPLAGVALAAAVAATKAPEPARASGRTLRNERVAAVIDASGGLRSLVIDGRRVELLRGAGVPSIAPDRPAQYDAWDIDRQALDLARPVGGRARIQIEERGGARAVIAVRRGIGARSALVLRYVLEAGASVVRIEAELDWREEETLLRLPFATGYRGQLARFGAPFGSTLRGAQPGSLANEAQWEAPGSRWAAVSHDGERDGLFLVTEAKYGFSARDGVLALTLVRSPRMTGFEMREQASPRALCREIFDTPYSDQGPAFIRFALGRYDAHAPRAEQPAALADTLFAGPVPYRGEPIAAPAGYTGIEGGETLVPGWAMPASGRRWVLRLHEVAGHAGVARVRLQPGWRATPVDLLSRPLGRALPRSGRLVYRPYGIVSLLIEADAG